MPLIKCPECGAEVSDSADKCNQCGYPINRSSENRNGKNLTNNVDPEFVELDEYYQKEFTKIKESKEVYKGKFNPYAWGGNWIWCLIKGCWAYGLIWILLYALLYFSNVKAFGLGGKELVIPIGLLYGFYLGFRGTWIYYCYKTKGSQFPVGGGKNLVYVFGIILTLILVDKFHLIGQLFKKNTVIEYRSNDKPNNEGNVTPNNKHSENNAITKETVTESEPPKVSVETVVKPNTGKATAISEKAFFYKDADVTTKRKAYIVKGQVVDFIERRSGFLNAAFTNEQGVTTKGWVLESDFDTTEK